MNKYFLLFFSVLIVVSCNKKKSESPKKEVKVNIEVERKKEIENIKKDIKKFKYKKAIENLEKLSKKYPRDPEIFYLIAIISKNNSSNLTKTIKILERSLKLNPDHLKSLILLGELQFLRKDDKKAIQVWKRALELDPKNRDVLYKIGYLYYTLRDYKNAIKKFEASINVDKKHFWSYYYLAGLYSEVENKPKKALTLLDKAIKIFPKNKELLTRAGNISIKAKDYKTALEFFKKLLEIDKDDAFVMEKISDCYKLMKNDKEAISWIKKIVDSRKNSVYHINKLSELYKSVGELDKSAELLNYIIRIDSKAKYKYELGELYIKLKRKDDVKNILKLLKDDKEDREASRYYNYLKNSLNPPKKVKSKK